MSKIIDRVSSRQLLDAAKLIKEFCIHSDCGECPFECYNCREQEGDVAFSCSLRGDHPQHWNIK